MKTCEHSGAIAHRSEYFHVEAADPNGEAGIVIHYLDEMLFGDIDTTERDFSLSSEGQQQTARRRFLRFGGYNDGPNSFNDQELTELTVRHKFDKHLSVHAYDVVISWRSLHDDIEGESRTWYSIEQYPQGNIQSNVDELDVVADAIVSRPMTNYDYRQLFDELAAMSIANDAERGYNGLSLWLEAE
jgi:hypothetical protein